LGRATGVECQIIWRRWFIAVRLTHLIFVKESQEGAGKLVEFDGEKVVAAWAQGKFVVPVWLDVIYGRSRERVKG